MFVFFAGGFETVASTLSYCLYELALNPDVQNKLREEILKTQKCSGLNYETVSGLSYLDMVLSGEEHSKGSCSKEPYRSLHFAGDILKK